MDKKGIWVYLRPIRGRRGFPPLGHAPREGPTPLGRRIPLPRV